MSSAPNITVIVSAILSSFTELQCPINNASIYPENYAPCLKTHEQFDFIIVGAGSAGTVIANRLTEVPEWKVLLVEAGGAPSKTSEIPALVLTLQGTDEDWNYRVEPGDYCLGFKDGKCSWPRGKMLGGSSGINGMLYVESRKDDHDNWVKAGCYGWDWETVQKYYKKLNAFEDPEHGYMKSSLYPYNDTHRITVYKALEALGVANINSDLRYYDSNSTIYDGLRFSNAKAYLAPIKNRPNLHVVTGALATKILIDESKHAYGVQVQIGQKNYKLLTKKEVILSAGSVNSPKLLMLSGIGPKKHLNKLHIPLIKNSDVGKNLQDHMAIFLFIKLNSSTQLDLNAFFGQCPNPQSPLSNLGITRFLGFINTERNLNYPDVELEHILFAKNDPLLLPTFLKNNGINDKTSSMILNANAESDLLLVVANLLKPYSRGKIILKSRNPHDDPLIYPEYLSDERDIEGLLRAIDFVVDDLVPLLEGATFFDYAPSCNCHEFLSRDYKICLLKQLGTTDFHPSGTCRMGIDDKAVLDPTLKVKGVKRLRVIDGSIMPTIVTSNTQIPITMFGERGSDFIKEFWRKL